MRKSRLAFYGSQENEYTETDIQNIHFLRDTENSSLLAETDVNDLSEGGMNPAEIHDRTILRKKVLGLKNNPEKQQVKLRKISLEE